MNKFGFQCQFDSEDAARYNRELQPAAVMVINVVKREFLAQLKAENPGVKLIYRHHPNYDWQKPSPEEAARQAVAQLKAEINPILDLLDYVTDNNEYILSKDHMAAEDIQQGDRYMAEFIREARRVLGLGTCWGNFNTGHWGAETVDYFPQALAAANEDGDSPICFHEYNWPTIPDPGFWTCGKILRAMPLIVAQYPRVRCMVTEFGVDDGGNPHKGWQLAHDDYATAVRLFCDGIRWYRDEVIARAPWLDAVLFFGCGMVTPWGSFEVAPIIDEIKLALEEEPGPAPPPLPEPPPIGGSKLDKIKVFKWDPGQERHIELTSLADKEALIYGKYGAGFRRATVASGQKVYRLVELWEKTGHSSLITQVMNEDGQPMANVDVTFYWPDAPDPPDPPTPVYPHDWYRNFVHGPTNVNGDIGPGMGRGAYHGEGEGGPHAVWIHDPYIPSDICEKLGMLAGTFHDHLDQKFQLQIAGEEPTPSPGGKTMWKEVSRNFTAGVPAQIHLHLSGGQPENYVDIRGDMKCGGWQLEEEVHPIKEGTGARLEFGCMYDKNEARTYVAWVYRLPNLERVSAEVACAFDANPALRGKYDVFLEWTSEPTPEPSPGPTPEPPMPTGTIGQIVAHIRLELDQIEAILAEYDVLAEQLADMI